MPTDRRKDVEQWMTRIQKSQAKRKDFESDWEQNYKQVYGADWLKDGKRDVSATSKQLYDFDLLLSFLKTELPTLVLHRPQVFLTARQEGEIRNPAAQQEAKRIESRVNVILGDMDGLETEIRCILADAHCAYGIIKVLPTTTSKAHPQAGQDVTDEKGNIVFDTETSQPLTYPEEELGQPDYDMSRVDPFKFLIDERAKNNPYKAAWKGEEIDRTLEEIKNSGLYDAKTIERLENKIKDKQGDKPDWEIELTLYEIYDRYNDRIIVICEEYPDDFLRYEDTPEGIEKDPYLTLKLTEIPGQWFPKPEMTSGRVHQKDYRQGREWQRSWARKMNPQLGMKSTFIDTYPEEVKKVGDGVSDSVKVNSESDIFPLNKDIMKSNVSLEEHMAMCLKDFDQTMGQSSQSRGLTGEAKFATEAEIAEMSGNVREQDKLQLVKTFFSKGIEKLLMLIRVNDAEPVEVRNPIISIDLHIEIDVESKTPKDRAIERKQLNEALTVILGNPAIMACPTLLDQIFRDYDIREKEKIIQELQKAVEMLKPQAPQKPGLNLSLSLKHELLPQQAIDMIVDMLMNADIPIASSPSIEAGGGEGSTPSPFRPSPNEAVGAGTEGMSPGSGMMPSGRIL